MVGLWVQQPEIAQVVLGAVAPKHQHAVPNGKRCMAIPWGRDGPCQHGCPGPVECVDVQIKDITRIVRWLRALRSAAQLVKHLRYTIIWK